MSDSEAIGNCPSRAELRERIVAERGKRTVSERGKRTIAEPRGGVSHPATELDEFRSEKSPSERQFANAIAPCVKLMRLSALQAKKC